MMVLLGGVIYVSLLLVAMMPRSCEGAGVKENPVERKFTIGDIGLFADRLLSYKVAPKQNFTIYDMYNKVRTDPVNLDQQAYTYKNGECDLIEPEDYSAFFPDVPDSYKYWTFTKVPVPTRNVAASMTAAAASAAAAPSPSAETLTQRPTPPATRYFDFFFPQDARRQSSGFLRQKSAEKMRVTSRNFPTLAATTAPASAETHKTTGGAAELTVVGDSASGEELTVTEPGAANFASAPLVSVLRGTSHAASQERHSSLASEEAQHGTEMLYIAPPPKMVKSNVTFCFQLVDKTSGYKALIIFNSNAPRAVALLPLSLSLALALFNIVNYY